MKAVALFLLLANLVYLAWTQWLAPPPVPPPSPAASGVPTLQLADEAGTDARMADAGDAEVAAPVPDATASPSTPPGDVAAPSGPDPELLSGVARCLSIGAFRNLTEITQASATLRAAGYEPRTRVAEGDVWAGLWVHLRALPSRDEAQRAMALLKERGVSDAYIMPSTEGSSEISLGIFSEPDRAQRRAEEVRALGFSPTVADRTRKGTVYWIDIDLKPTDALINPADVQSESGKIVRLEVQACPVAGQAAG